MTSPPMSRTVLILDSCRETQAQILVPGPVDRALSDGMIAEGSLPQNTGPVQHQLRPQLSGDLVEQTIRGRSEHRLIVNHDPVHIQEMISWLVSYSAWGLPDIQRLRMRGALHELLLNAVEHGTLELGFEAKRKALAEGRYKDLLMQRLAQPRLKDRHVTVHVRYEKGARSLTYRIADEGNGFNWRRLLTSSCSGGEADGANGRGIFLARSLFPGLTYNDRGNEVTMTVPLS